MTKTQRARNHRADAPRQWQEALLEIRNSSIKNRELAKIADPLIVEYKHIGPSVAMEILTAVAIEIAMCDLEAR